MEFCGTGHKNESFHSLLILEYIGLVGYQEKFLLGKSSQTLAQAARGLMESPGGVPETWRCGTEGGTWMGAWPGEVGVGWLD